MALVEEAEVKGKVLACWIRFSVICKHVLPCNFSVLACFASVVVVEPSHQELEYLISSAMNPHK